MTVALFVLIVGMAIAAVETGLSSGTPAYPVVFFGLSAVSFYRSFPKTVRQGV
jgi:hypothetical protein